MPKEMRIAVLRNHHDNSFAAIPDQACEEVLRANNSRTSVAQYWADCTQGHLQLQLDFMPWVSVPLAKAGDHERELEASKAYEATAAANMQIDLAGYDGYIVLSHPGTVPNPAAGQPNEPDRLALSGGATGLKEKTAAVLPVTAPTNHTFMCHEVGHVAGFRHTYGLANNGRDWNNQGVEAYEYGDPYDIMSSAMFGSRRQNSTVPGWWADPTFADTLPNGWPNADAFNSMGPAPARAHVHSGTPPCFRTRQ